MTARMMQWVMVLALLSSVAGNSIRSQRDKRQVTYQADDNQADDNQTEKEPDFYSVRPVTRKPLPAQVVYPGDLSSFFTTESSNKKDSNETLVPLDSSPKHIRQKRGGYIRDKSEEHNTPTYKERKISKPLQTKYRQLQSSESRLHASYHTPSVSVMNDIPAELYFDGAGFLRYEEDSEEVNNNQNSKSRGSPRSHGSHEDKNRALNDFRAAFNMSRDRNVESVKFDDETSYQNAAQQENFKDSATDRGAQGTENGTPLTMDFMQAFQQGMFEATHPSFASQIAQLSQPTQSFQQDPFSFTYPTFYNGQPSLNPLTPPVIQQDSLLQNHRTQIGSNLGITTPPALYSNVPQQGFQNNAGFPQNQNFQQFHKTQRRKRSTSNSKRSEDKIPELFASPSQQNQDHYKYSRIDDQQDSSSGFIPITGTFNGGTIQLNFPFYGNNPMSPPSYQSRAPVQAYHTYSVPVRTEGRPYRSMERLYHPSEARRYSYGILGSGNFEVIRGGVFPNERPHGLHGGYPGGRIPYGGDEFGNYGTTEIIIDGPIQGFQGFDNFPAHLINALSKHSEIAVRPDRRETNLLAA